MLRVRFGACWSLLASCSKQFTRLNPRNCHNHRGKWDYSSTTCSRPLSVLRWKLLEGGGYGASMSEMATHLFTPQNHGAEHKRQSSTRSRVPECRTSRNSRQKCVWKKNSLEKASGVCMHVPVGAGPSLLPNRRAGRGPWAPDPTHSKPCTTHASGTPEPLHRLALLPRVPNTPSVPTDIRPASPHHRPAPHCSPPWVFGWSLPAAQVMS